MSNQAHFWSLAARNYESEFIDPFRADVQNPLLDSLRRVHVPHSKTTADLGCGVGALLPVLAGQFRHVFAVDFAEGMLERAKESLGTGNNVEFLCRRLSDLPILHGRIDVAVAVNSLVMPDPHEVDESLQEIRRVLRPGGILFAIVPGMDAVHYYTMLLLDRARSQGKTLEAARKNAAHFNEHSLYDFAFGQFRFQGLDQHFWQPFEIPYRLHRAGFRLVRQEKVHLSWDQIAITDDVRANTPPWDWFFEAAVN